MITRPRQAWIVGSQQEPGRSLHALSKGRPSGFRRVGDLLGDLFTCAVAFGYVMEVSLVGQFPLGELILLPAVPFLVFTQGRKLRGGKIAKVLLLGVIWLLGQIITDLYRQTAFMDWARGDARILMFLIDLIGLTILLRDNQRRKILFIVTLAVAFIIKTRLFPDDDQMIDPWKFGYAFGTAWIVVVGASYFYFKKQYTVAAMILITLSIINVGMGSRSTGLILFLATVFVLPVIPERLGRTRIKELQQDTMGRLIFLLSLGCLAGGLMGVSYSWAASAGLLGPAAQEKYEMQSRGKLGVLIGGRAEILASTVAIKDSPILGHGSWAKDPKYYYIMQDLRDQYGYDTDENREPGEFLIPSHSHLFGSWVESGILGAVFWGYFIWLMLQGILRAIQVKSWLSLLCVYQGILALWDVIFSPFGTDRRMTEAFILVLISDLWGRESVRKVAQKIPKLSRLRHARFSA